MTENLKKKLIYRSKFRGCKETDILLGNFAESGFEKLNNSEVELYAKFIEEEDGYIYKWLAGQETPPSEYAILCQKILDK